MTILGPMTGLWMLLILGLLTVNTGLPVWALLIGVSTVFAIAGVAAGVMDLQILAAMPERVVGLLDNDLLQALPLYIFVGMMLQRLALADGILSVLVRAFRPVGGELALATLGVGALIAPMNGSVASTASLISRLVAPRLAHCDPAPAMALASAASTIGVVIPPSLVLILLGDAMMRAHTEAVNFSGSLLLQSRVINTQDLFNAALLPGLCVLLLWALVARWQGRGWKSPSPALGDECRVLALVAVGVIVLLLSGVFAGKLFAVEAAATGAVLLVLTAGVSRRFGWRDWQSVLGDALRLSGALMALLIGATVFSLVFRLFATDRWLSGILLNSPFPPWPTAAATLLLVGLCAWVLDAFEMIFVVLPIVAPPLIVMLGDARQVAVLLLLVLQLSFLVPPMGYAVMMTRSAMVPGLAARKMLKALAPYLALQMLVVVVVFLWPAMVHQLDHLEEPQVQDAEQSVIDKLRQMSEKPERAEESATPASKEVSAQ